MTPDDREHSEGSSFGDELRKQREIRGISLREIADSTKISTRFLEAIERDDFETLPAAVFTRGFIREYARYVGLDPGEQVDRYEHFIQAIEEVEAPEIRAAAKQEAIRRDKLAAAIPQHRIRRVVVIAVILVPLILGFFWLRRQFSSSPGVDPAAVTTAPVATRTTPERVPPGEAVPSESGELRLVVEATEDSWLVLHADGSQVHSDVVRAGQRMEFTAREQFELKSIGNAGGVRLTLNDRTLPPLGRTGQVVRDHRLDRNTLSSPEAQ
ncbi:MAG TPA: RodZ domain-containing protein [Thermoanaerobaculia bacterium]|nr:RodZ domain-containing protein [Thermoanaerobaculia bacterium]